MSFCTRSHYINTYRPLVTQFANQIREINYDRIPEPFLPVHGTLYETVTTRISFVGKETRGGRDSSWGNTTDFVRHVDTNPDEAIFREFEEFEELAFCDWGNNWGTGFWDFLFRLLAIFYGIDDWRALKRGENKDILRSFAWGNTNAIEGYEVTAQQKGVLHDDWLAVKEASKCFDQGKHLIEVLRPHLMIITDWDAPEGWLLDGLIDRAPRQELDEHLWYYFLPITKTHVLWTAHPRWLSQHPDLDTWSKKLVGFAKQRMDA